MRKIPKQVIQSLFWHVPRKALNVLKISVYLLYFRNVLKQTQWWLLLKVLELISLHCHFFIDFIDFGTLKLRDIPHQSWLLMESWHLSWIHSLQLSTDSFQFFFFEIFFNKILNFNCVILVCQLYNQWLFNLFILSIIDCLFALTI